MTISVPPPAILSRSERLYSAYVAGMSRKPSTSTFVIGCWGRTEQARPHTAAAAYIPSTVCPLMSLRLPGNTLYTRWFASRDDSVATACACSDAVSDSSFSGMLLTNAMRQLFLSACDISSQCVLTLSMISVLFMCSGSTSLASVMGHRAYTSLVFVAWSSALRHPSMSSDSIAM